MRAPSTRGSEAESVTRNWHSVWVRSRTSSSPRCVGLAPTTTAPASAAPWSQKTNSGTLSKRTATWNGPSRAPGLQPGGPGGGPCDHLGVAQPQVAGHEPEARVVGPGEHGAGDGLGGLPPPAASAEVTTTPNVSDLGWNPHYWNTLHFSPHRVTVAGTPAERTAAP